jgi:pimeloyl-ACP methyl ester carboxylesterase
LDWKVTDRELERTRTPTLVVWGRQDKVYAPARAQAFGWWLPNATVTVLDRCGHTPMLDHADRLNPLLSSFLRGAA